MAILLSLVIFLFSLLLTIHFLTKQQTAFAKLIIIYVLDLPWDALRPVYTGNFCCAKVASSFQHVRNPCDIAATNRTENCTLFTGAVLKLQLLCTFFNSFITTLGCNMISYNVCIYPFSKSYNCIMKVKLSNNI